MASGKTKDVLSGCRLNQIVPQLKELFAHLVAVLGKRNPLLLIKIHLFQEKKDQQGNKYRHGHKDNKSCLLVAL